jgi:hypothetical protein
MSDLEHPQDQQDDPSKTGGIRLPRETTQEEEIELLEKALDAFGEDKPVAPSSLEDDRQVQHELAVEDVRQKRAVTERLTEGNKDISFKRKMLIVVLAILALVAMGSLGAIAAGIATGMYPVAASAVLSLSGAGGGSVFAWNVYVKATTLAKPEPEPTGEGP